MNSIITEIDMYQMKYNNKNRTVMIHIQIHINDISYLLYNNASPTKIFLTMEVIKIVPKNLFEFSGTVREVRALKVFSVRNLM